MAAFKLLKAVIIPVLKEAHENLLILIP